MSPATIDSGEACTSPALPETIATHDLQSTSCSESARLRYHRLVPKMLLFSLNYGSGPDNELFPLDL